MPTVEDGRSEQGRASGRYGSWHVEQRASAIYRFADFCLHISVWVGPQCHAGQAVGANLLGVRLGCSAPFAP